MKQIVYSLIIILFSSCASQKKISYLQDVSADYSMDINQQKDAKIQSDDWISIMVNSKDMELIRMFNLPIVSNSMIGKGSSSGGTNSVSGYLVDDNGYIDFPQLGIIKIKGLTLTQLSVLIKKKLICDGYVKDPVVTVQYTNFKISLMGEVKNPGIFSVSTGKISLFEALSMAGDLTIYGKRGNVKVIREENGIRNIVNLDLRSKKIFDSPYFYLHQNDVVYVEPNMVKAGQSSINQNLSVGTFTSISWLLISLSVLIF